MEKPANPSDEGHHARIFVALARAEAIGLCLFDISGQVTGRIGPGATFLPDIGSNIEESPLFVGLMETVRGLLDSGGFVELPSLGISAHSASRFDLRICWLESEAVFAALVFPASERIKLEFTVAHAARQNRLLMEQVQRQEEEISAQNELMRLFINHVPAAVAMLDKDLHYLMVSQRWRDDFACEDKDILNQPFASALSAPARRWESALHRPQDVSRSGIEKLADRQGGASWHRWERQDWLGAGTTAGGTLVFSENITRSVEQTARLRAQAARLIALNQEMRQFALAVSHDLRAPIRQINAFAQFLKEDHGVSIAPEGVEYVDMISQCATRMLGMVDALLAYAKISMSAPVMGRLSLAKAVAAACLNLKSSLVERQVQVACRTKLAVHGDATLVALVFQNLIDNSLKYAKAQPLKIVIDAERHSQGITVRFCDNGGGIPPNLQDKAFDLFQRLGAAHAVLGAGVGLATCRKILELHGGSLVIDRDFGGGLQLVLQMRAAR